MLSPQQLSLLNKNKLIEMVFKNYQQSQINSTKRKQIDTACTILSGSSNNETIDDNVNTSQVQHPTVKKTGINFKTNNAAVIASQFHIKSADATKRSQSGEGTKSNRNQKIIKNSKEGQNQEKGGSFLSFFANPKELEFLTKTIGVMPSHSKQSQLTSNRKQKSQGKKSGHSSVENNQGNSKINRKKNVSSEAIKIGGITAPKDQNYQHLYKSFQNYPNVSYNSAAIPAATKNSASKQLDHQQGKIPSQASTANTSSQFLSQKFLQTLKAFTSNYYGIQQQKNQNKCQKAGTHLEQVKPAKKRERSESQALKSAKGIQSSSRQLKFGQIMEELERFSLNGDSPTNQDNMKTHQNNLDPMLETEESIAEVQSSMITESELEYSQGGNIRASTYKRNADSEKKKKTTHFKSEERKNETAFFTQEYLENRYVNSRVEMELEEFKKEIESKFKKSEMKQFVFSREKSPKKVLHQSFEQKPLQVSEYHTSIPLEKVKSIKAMFQNFVKQTCDGKKKTNLNILVTSEDKIEPDFNSFTQLTFDSSHPNYASNYVGMKKGNKTVIKDHSKFLNKGQVSDNQSQSQKSVSKQTPKNYSLQLNQVVKKILSDQQNIGQEVETVMSSGGNQANNTSCLDTMYEPCFYTTNVGQQRLDSHSNFITRDLRQKVNADDEGNNRFSCSSSSKGGKQKAKERNKYRSDSNNKLQKNSLINKFFRQQNQTVNSPQSRQPKIKQIKEGAQTNQEEKFSKPVSALASNLSTNRNVQLVNNKNVLQTRRQGSSSNKTTAKSTQKNSRLASSTKKNIGSNILVNVSNFQVQTATNSNITFNIQDKGVTEQSFAKDPKPNQLMIKNSQIKRSVEGVKHDLKSKVQPKKKETAPISSTQQQSKTLLQRSFHHQVQQNQNPGRTTQNAKSSTTSSPHSHLKQSNQKSSQKGARTFTLANQASNSKSSSKGNLKIISAKQHLIGQKQIVLSKICSAERVNTEQMQINHQLHL